jgi:hypothetical protein
MARDILKIKFMCSGYELRDDDCLYKNNQCVAKNVQVVSEEHDHIAFSLDTIDDRLDIGSDLGFNLLNKLTPATATLH